MNPDHPAHSSVEIPFHHRIMDIETTFFLLGEQGRAAIECVSGLTDDTLAAGELLRKHFPGLPPGFLSAALECALLRERASRKFSRAGEMFFTREALEQATGELVAAHRARRFTGLDRVCDACCGIGGDAIALGKAAGHITCVDTDPARLAFCRENLAVYGIDGDFLCRDIMTMADRTSGFDALFIDPSRRSGSRRTRHLHEMTPPIREVEELLGRVGRGAAKLPTATDYSAITIPCELEWVGTREGLKEAVMWTGDFRECGVSVSLPDRGAFLRDSDVPDTVPETAQAGTYIYEPDPALIRSGLLGGKAVSLGMHRISDRVAYMSADEKVGDPFFSAFRVLRRMKFGMRRLGDALNEMGVGSVTVKKRAFPMLPEEVIGKLRLKGNGHATVILTKELGRNTAYIVEAVR